MDIWKKFPSSVSRATLAIGYDADNLMTHWSIGATTKNFNYDASNRRGSIDHDDDGIVDGDFRDATRASIELTLSLCDKITQTFALQLT